MPRLVVVAASVIVLADCNAVAGIAGGGDHAIVSVTVLAPAGLLVGESIQIQANATEKGGFVRPNVPATWRSSDPAAISVSSDGLITGLIGGRQATITASFNGKSGSATVIVGSGDSRFGYALGDQPSNPGPYTPAASTRFNSSGGNISITRVGAGAYNVLFAGLARTPGQRDIVQVSASGPAAAYCKPGTLWQNSGADMLVFVNCMASDGTGTQVDNPFTVLLVGSRAFAASPRGFLLSLGDSGNVTFDTSATAFNSAGGLIATGSSSEGEYPMVFTGLGPASAGMPVGMFASPVGGGGKHCRLGAYDLANSGLFVECAAILGAARNNAFAVLWMTKGRPGMRYGFALANNQATTDVATPAEVSGSSTGGTIVSKRTATGVYRVLFPGLARPAGTTDIVIVEEFGGSKIDVCSVLSWANSGNDLAVNVGCFKPDASSDNSAFTVLVVQ